MIPQPLHSYDDPATGGPFKVERVQLISGNAYQLREIVGHHPTQADAEAAVDALTAAESQPDTVSYRWFDVHVPQER